MFVSASRAEYPQLRYELSLTCDKPAWAELITGRAVEMNMSYGLRESYIWDRDFEVAFLQRIV